MKKRIMAIVILVCIAALAAVGAFSAVFAADSGSDGEYRIQGYDNNTGEYIIAKYNVKDYGAVGDGVTDDTAAFTRLFSELRRDADLTGAVVYVPAGKYKITRSLAVPENVHLRGQWNDPSLGTDGEESVLLAYVDPLDEEWTTAAPPQGFLSLNSHATVTDMVICYPEQDPENIRIYPYSIQANAHMVNVKNITLINSYFGINMGVSDKGSSHVVQNIYGTVLRRGVMIDNNFSDGVVQNIHFSSDFWKEYGGLTQEQVESVKSFTSQNATAVYIGKSDDYVVCEVDCPSDEFAEVFSVNYNPNIHDTETGTPPMGYGVAMGLHGASTIQHKPDDYNATGSFPVPKDIDGVKGADQYSYEGVPSRFSAKADLFNVKDYGATGNSADDATFALAAALEEAGKNGGGIVYLPAGTYQISAPLTVPSNVEIRGESEDVWMGEATRIAVNWGKDRPEAALFTLSAGSGIQGVSFRTVGLYQECVMQTLQTGSLQVPEWAWMVRGNGKEVWLENVEFYNVVRGIDFASAACDNFVINGIYGTTLIQGAQIGSGTAGGRIENFQVGYSLWFEGEGRQISFNDFLTYTSHYLTGLTFGDCSDIVAFNVGGFGLKNTVVLHSENGNVPTNMIFYKILADAPYGHNGVLAEAGDKITMLGLSTGVSASMYEGEAIGRQINVTDTFDGKMRVIVQNSWNGAPNVIADGKDVQIYAEGEQETDLIQHDIRFADFTVTGGQTAQKPPVPPQTVNHTGLILGIGIAVAVIAIGAAVLIMLLRRKNG